MKPEPLVYDPPETAIDIRHVDDDLLVLSKPSGLLSVPGKAPEMADCLEVRARSEFPNALLVHRLDMETSGIFVMAMNKDTQANLGKQFERRKVEKTYIAEIWGRPAEDEGLIDLPLRCDWERRPKQMVCHEHGRSAQTHWRILERRENSARVELKPVTGRSHQLRVHMMAMGHPILGDPFYAPDEAREGIKRLQLHAQTLSLFHPASGKRVTFSDPVPF